MFSKLFSQNNTDTSPFSGQQDKPRSQSISSIEESSGVQPIANLAPPKRRWSYVTYLNQGTLHADDDNLMLGL